MLAGCFAASANAAYLVDLGTLPGGHASYAAAISDSGQVVGSATTVSGTTTAISWTAAGGMVAIGAPAAHTYSAATAVNESGQVVGYWSSDGGSSGGWRGFSWTEEGGMRDLGTLPGSSHAFVVPRGVDDAGQVVGSTTAPDGLSHPFTWTEEDGIVDRVGTIGFGSSTYPSGVNAGGQVVGGASRPGETDTAFSWTEAGGTVDLGRFPNSGFGADAAGVSDSGRVVGIAARNDGSQHGFSWTFSTGMVDIGTLPGAPYDRSSAEGVNDSGQVIGSSSAAEGYDHAISWTDEGGIVDLGTLPGAEQSYSYATGINNSGQIVGYSSTYAGDVRAFITTDVEPPPAPDTHAPALKLTTPTNKTRLTLDQVALASYSCFEEPSGSGLDTCSGTVPNGAPLDTSTAGSHSFTVRATDKAGNVRSQTIKYTVLGGKPKITVTAPADGATYVLNEIVRVAYTCEPNGSPISECSGTARSGKLLDTSTTGTQTFTVEATDEAGNSQSKTVTYTVVEPPLPTIAITTPADGATYGRGAVVNADYSCASAPGAPGLTTCNGPVGNGTAINTAQLGDHTFAVTALDNDGREVSRSVTYTVRDLTAPKIVPAAPAQGDRYMQGASVAASYACTDEKGGSGLASCSGTVPSGESIDTSTLGHHTFQITARDKAGNETSRQIGYDVIDLVDPTVAIETPADGATYEQGTTVQAVYSCGDEENGSGVASCEGTVATGDPIDTGTLGDHTFTVEALDEAGNSNSKTVHYSVVDVKAPTISLTAPVDGATYTLGDDVQAAYACADEQGGSGLASCTGDVDSGSAIDTLTAGPNTFTVRAEDHAGNPAQRSVTYTVKVTPKSLCALTRQYLRSSGRYSRLSAAQKAATDRLGTAACQVLDSVVPKLKPAQKAQFIAVYKKSVDALAASSQGWLTSAQASKLKELADAL
jgi:probable HAF family extracellular repeat protein